MKPIFKNEPKIKSTIETHLALIPQLQTQVDLLENNGLSPEIEDLKDLINHGQRLKEKATALIEKEAKNTSNLPAIQEETITSLTEVYNDIISGVKSKLESILMAYSSLPKSLDAYVLDYGKVVPNLDWQKEIEDRYTVEATGVRLKTMELCRDVLSAIVTLYKHIKDHDCSVRAFRVYGAGIDASVLVDESDEADVMIINKYKSNHYTPPSQKERNIAIIKAIIAGEFMSISSDDIDTERPYIDLITQNRYKFNELNKVTKPNGKRMQVFFADEKTADRFVTDLETYY